MSLTEQPNELTLNIDIASPVGIVRHFRQVDSQLFCGYLDYDSVNDLLQIKNTTLVAKHFLKFLRKFINGGNSQIIFSGSGTSGRLAYFCSRNYNKIVKQLFKKKSDLFSYLMAGGDKALIRAQEAAEDKPLAGVNDLKNNFPTIEKDEFMLIGISCGLSAPYAAGQLDYTIPKKNFVSVLLGFNPSQYARNKPIEGWGKTVSQVVAELLSKNDDYHILWNPVVGPEAITGSTRMKGGSATKILLDVAFISSIICHLNDIPIEKSVFQLLHAFETTYRYTYKYVDTIAQIVDLAQHSLISGGHLYYLGCDTAGLLGFIDASECPPTFGAKFTDVRGFIYEGWKRLDVRDQKMEQYGFEFNIDIENFVQSSSNLTKDDLVVFIGIEEYFQTRSSEYEYLISIMDKLKKSSSAKIVWLWISYLNEPYLFPLKYNHPKNSKLDTTIPKKSDVFLNVKIPYCGFLPESYGLAEFSIKLVLNAITTGAHILKGTIYGNRMINLKVSNNKLFYRAIGIISEIGKVDQNKARECLLKAIYGDTIDLSKTENFPISYHIESAAKREKVVPIALLLASGKVSSVASAERLLKEYPIVRNAIKSI